ncbi:MAG: cytochrome c oxidase subunit 3 [Anaerolineae bacterium]
MSEARLDMQPVAPVADAHDHGHGGHSHAENLKFAMWLFLASEVVLFTVLIAAYLVFAVAHRELVKEIHEAVGILLVSGNTFILITSSWTMVMGLRELQRGNIRGLRRWIFATALLGLLFFGLQMVEYSQLAAIGITMTTEFGAHFYAPTMLHGAHVLAGVVWALFVVRQAGRNRYSATNTVGVEVFGLYWHFVDVIWIFIFTCIYLL